MSKENGLKTKPVGYSESDATHPRFKSPDDPEKVLEYQKEHDYYCKFCKLFFAPTVTGLKTHFSGDMVNHPQYGTCFYCKGKVFAYELRGETHIHHDCIS